MSDYDVINLTLLLNEGTIIARHQCPEAHSNLRQALL